MPRLKRTITSLGLICLGMGLAGPLMPATADDDGHGGAAGGVKVETLARSSQDWTGGQLPRYPDALIELVNRVHRGKSLGPEPAVIVVVYAGAEGLPTTVLDPGQSPGL
ncbi:MAG: hypothetical protein ACO28M_11705 [Vulcanococcus sp.]